MLLPSFQRPISRVAIRRAGQYQDDLESLLLETLREFDLPVKGKTVLLKANFVSRDPGNVINTHPAVVGAARECFLRLGAAAVTVADGPALERDTEAILDSMRLREYIGPLQDNFLDLNVDTVRCIPLRSHATTLKEMCFPEAVLSADFVVSMAKLKTHHWAGVTLSMKNMFGIVPGSCYGWPKNVLHWAGISRSILDINSTIRPNFAIVDGIVGMEGNGPIQGTPKACGVLVLGDDPVAVDSTCARIMGFNPGRIEYLMYASYLLGNLQEDKIQQIGEGISLVQTDFEVLPNFRKLKIQKR
jgi:uncharacterized protein (DUF362 family)